MDVTEIIEPLNEPQREAVTAESDAALVLAGAGSGKTRVLVHRIAWLVRAEGAAPHSILAVTFTNKAASEMRGRIHELLKFSISGMWIGTFHGLAHRLLRRHAEEVGLPATFQIIDGDDQYRLLRRLFKSLQIDEARWPPRQAQWFINSQKDEGRRAAHLADNGDPFMQQMIAVYRAYEAVCNRSGLVDFAELLLRAHEFLRDSPAALGHYQTRFRYVLVDEFQDTNTIQYAWLQLLTRDNQNLFVVGDDDQSIYGWRGAKIENIHRYGQDYPNHHLIRLEQNYRSSGHILTAANALIANNSGRLGKKLWTNDKEGEPIALYTAFNEQDEAYFVIDRIRQWVKDGNRRDEAAILYRSNAQSRLFEERLVATGTPYRVFGGLRFFERAEIKNALAYLRLVSNRDDDPSFERIVNTPARGIGARTLDLIREKARGNELSLWQAAAIMMTEKSLSPRAASSVKSFLDLITQLAAETADCDLAQQTHHVVERSQLKELYKKEEGEKSEARIENLDELANAARQFNVADLDDPEIAESASELDLFLAHAALEAGETQGDNYDDCVQLMTLHSAKGLEFKLVFIAGLEEGLFPSQQSLEEAGRLEEERRLCYVGITRAMEQLYLTYAESRRLYGRENYPRPSRFVGEIPSEQIREVRMRASISRPVVAVANNAKGDGFSLGQRVVHAKFGEGVVLHREGEGSHARVQVNFEEVGTKWLVMSFANLTAL